MEEEYQALLPSISVATTGPNEGCAGVNVRGFRTDCLRLCSGCAADIGY